MNVINLLQEVKEEKQELYAKFLLDTGKFSNLDNKLKALRAAGAKFNKNILQ